MKRKRKMSILIIIIDKYILSLIYTCQINSREEPCNVTSIITTRNHVMMFVLDNIYWSICIMNLDYGGRYIIVRIRKKIQVLRHCEAKKQNDKKKKSKADRSCLHSVETMGKLIVDCYMSRKTKKDLFRNWWDHIWFKWQPLQPSSGPDFGRAHRESDATEYSHCKNNAKRSGQLDSAFAEENNRRILWNPMTSYKTGIPNILRTPNIQSCGRPAKKRSAEDVRGKKR
jgi:hypothetical protein